VLRGLSTAYDGRRQHVLKSLSPKRGLCQCLEADLTMADTTYKPPSSRLITRALRIVDDANKISHPNDVRFKRN
jgi:hypothetical protein